MKLWICLPEWEGLTCYIVAGGPSVAAQDLTVLRGRKIIAINSSYEKVPFAEYLFFGDSRWWFNHHPSLKDFNGKLVTVSAAALHPSVLNMRKINPPPGLTDIRTAIAMRRTSLQGAINLAVHLGSTRIVVIGADMQAASDGRTHHHRPHPWPQRAGCWDEQMADLRLVNKPAKRLGIEIVNASPSSRIDWWQHKPLKECLQWP